MDIKNQIKFHKLFVIVVAWQLIAVTMSIYDHFTLVGATYSLGPSSTYSFGISLGFHMLSSFMGAITGGSFLVFYVNERFRTKSYGYNLTLVCITYIVVYVIIVFISSAIFAVVMTGKPLTHPDTYQYYIDALFRPVMIRGIIIWAVIVALTQLTLQLNDKFGPGILWAIIKGKYHEPQEETRIFMFLDLRSSTTIAEKLGNELYHNLLKDFYADITNSIIYNKGEIYQYVGDEVVISWKMENGLENHNCIKCFFDMRKTITGLKQKYQSKYDLVPDFKAGLHYGKVIAGEIGIIKRDITYSGDVLNTTARIQSECNKYNVDLLLSKDLVNSLQFGDNYETRSIGKILLRGKQKEVELETVIV